MLGEWTCQKVCKEVWWVSWSKRFSFGSWPLVPRGSLGGRSRGPHIDGLFLGLALPNLTFRTIGDR